MKKILPFLLFAPLSAFAQSPNGDPELFEKNKPVIKLSPDSPAIESQIDKTPSSTDAPSLAPPTKQTPKNSVAPLEPPSQAKLQAPDLSTPHKPFIAKPPSNQYRDIYFGYTEIGYPSDPAQDTDLKLDAGTFGFQYTHLSYPAQEGKANIGLRLGAEVTYGKEKLPSENGYLHRDKHHLLGSITLSPVVAFHLTDNFMVYGQGGAAFSYVNVKSDQVLDWLTQDDEISDMALGYTYGGGLNYAFADNSTLGLEYQYRDIKHEKKNKETFNLNTHTVKLTFGKRF